METENAHNEVSQLSDLSSPIPAKIPRSGRLGGRRRKMVLVIAMIGLTSFASPLIRTDSPVLGRTQWSPLQVVIDLHKGTLPDCQSYSELCEPPNTKLVYMTLDVTLGFGTAYAALLAIVVAALLLPRAEFVGASAGLAALLILKDGQYGFDDLQAFFGSHHHAHGRALELALVGIFGLLIWISATKALD
jgi:hypothetical protein